MATYHERAIEASGMGREDFAAWVWKCRNLPASERKNKQWQLTYPHQPIGWYLARGNPNQKSLWVPHPQEVRACCQVLSDGQGRWNLSRHPWIYQRHCRTLRHISMLFNVDERDIRARVTKPRKRCNCGKFISIEDYACRNCKG